jgi:predicted porin
VGYQYDFSKRTSFYSSLTRFDNGSGPGLGRFNTSIPRG